jgi:hypothetical protein
MPPVLAALAALALAAGPSKLAVLPVGAGEGIPAGTAAALTETLSGEVRRRAGVEVITQREISAVLSLERQKEMLGCTSDACMAELGGALGCDRLVTGDVARLGESWLVHLRLVETARARVAAQSDRRLRGGTIDDVLDQLPAMVAELFPAGAPAPTSAQAPAAATPAAPGPGASTTVTVTTVPVPAAKPAAPRWAEEPVDVPLRDRLRMRAWSDGAGHLLVTEPFVMDAPLWWGDEKKLFRVRVRGGGQQGLVEMSRNFWEPRTRRGAEAEFEVRDGKATLTCGAQVVPLVLVPPRDLPRRMRSVAFFEPRWRRIPHALARDDAGTYYFVDGARGADGAALAARPDYRLFIGRKGALAPVALDDSTVDAGGALYLSAAGRLELKPGGKGGSDATWITASGRKPLTWLEPADHAPLIYGELGVYAGELLGTPCDGRL